MAGRLAVAAAALSFESPEESDPFGFVPRFEWAGPAGVIRGPSIEAMLAAGAAATIDYDALSVFLRLGFFVGDDTPFDAIRAVPARRQPYTGCPLQLSRNQAIDAFIQTFRAAMRRCRPSEEFHLPLSGGRDSRHILCALVDDGFPPQACVTIEHFPPRGNDDVAIAAALCARLGVRHVVLPQRRDRIRAEREKNRRTHLCTDEHAQFVGLADYLAMVTRETYDGIAGDVLSQSGYLNPDIQRLFERHDITAVANYLLDGYGISVSERALARLVSPSLMRELPRERAIARLSREIARHVDAPNPAASFFFWNRTRREVALSPFALMRDLHVHAPYLDDDVYSLLSAMPASLQMDRQLHTDAIRRAYPGVADIPFESRTQTQQRPGFHRREAFELGRLLLGAPSGMFSSCVIPPLLMTIVDGSAHRLWFAASAVYLAQLSAVAVRAR